MQDAIDRIRAAQVAECLHPRAPLECRGSIVKAHSIARSRHLKPIAKNDEVYVLNWHPVDYRRAGGLPPPKLTNIRSATTFQGFCSRHDKDLFSPIEDRSLLPDQEQLLLLAYRSLTKEIHARREALMLYASLRKSITGPDLFARVARRRELDGFVESVRRGGRDLEAAKRTLDDWLTEGRFEGLRSLVLFSDSLPDLACAAPVLPECTFNGEPLQDLGSDGLLDPMFFTMLPTSGGSVVAFSWIDGAAAPALLADSLLRLPFAEIPDAVHRFVFEFFENRALRPQWWDSLPDSTRSALMERTRSGINPRLNREPSCLLADGVQSASWVLDRIERT